MAPSLVTCPTRNTGIAELFGKGHESGSGFPDLANAAGGGRDILRIKGLDGIYGQQVRPQFRGPGQKILNTGTGHDVEVFRPDVQPISPHFDLL